MNAKTILIAAASALLLLGAGEAANAQAPAAHPRAAEVNTRLHTEGVRIHRERAEGKMSAAKAHRLHRSLRRIHREEVRMARRHHGHLTPREQARLNHQENRVSTRINR